MRINESAIGNRRLLGPFRDDGLVPNSNFPAIVYPSAVHFESRDPSESMEVLQENVWRNGWKVDWKGNVYRKVHYHSTAHECLVVFRDQAQIELGGRRFGQYIKMKPGDVLLIPAGMGHEQLTMSRHFLVFGLYPDDQDWDLNWGWEKERGNRRGKADYNIKRVALPHPNLYTDPIFGRGGPLMELWKK